MPDRHTEFGLLVARLSRRLRQSVDAEMRLIGLTEATWRPLIYLRSLGDGVRQKELATAMSIEGPSLVRLLDSLEIDAPFGLGKVYSGTEGEAALRRYLEQPQTIYLGQGDTRDDERNDYPEALAQGASRYQRGVNVFNAAKTLAQARGWKFNWRLVELPGVGHSARKMFSAPQAFEALSP